MRRFLVILALAIGLAGPALAVNPSEMLADPAQEHRARELGKDLRCLVCQNQSIDDSDADLAKDLRIIVRERISAGDSDEMVMKFVVDRYGDYVLLKPPFRLGTYALWFGPLLLLGLSVLTAFAFYRRAGSVGTAAPAPLSDDEQRKLDELMVEQPKQ